MLYGITIDQHDCMLREQNNKCAICFEVFLKIPHVDHNHISGELRGLLCSKCNTGIGYFKEDKNILISAINYLKKWGG